MSDITGQDIWNAYEQAMDNTAPVMTRVLGVLISEISFNPTGNLAGRTTSNRVGDTIESSSTAHYWQWWLNGRGAITPKRAKFLHFFVYGREVFAKSVKAFKGHRDTLEPKYEQQVVKQLDTQLNRFFGAL